MTLEFHPFDVHKPVSKYFRDLPHWRQEGGTYFVTFRLWDSLPAAAVEHLRLMRRVLEKMSGCDEAWVEAERALFRELKRFLDAGHGACFMREARIAQMVGDALGQFDGDRYQIGEWAVMSNHVHVIVQPLPRWVLEDVLRGWKSYTAHRINAAFNRTGRVWQEESYDRIVRDTAELRRTERYIRKNRCQSVGG